MKQVAVIGAGASGLAAIKCCLDEGLEPVCFERSSYISGLWHYTEAAEEGQACVMKSTVINTSKEMMCYSDFPIPDHFAIYMHNTKVDEYFHMYADKFGLIKHINFLTEVSKQKLIQFACAYVSGQICVSSFLFSLNPQKFTTSRDAPWPYHGLWPMRRSLNRVYIVRHSFRKIFIIHLKYRLHRFSDLVTPHCEKVKIYVV
jgi:hypothetical protein